MFIYNGNVYLVTDDSYDFPTVSAIVSSTGPGFGEWKLLTTKQAVDLFGEFGGVYVMSFQNALIGFNDTFFQDSRRLLDGSRQYTSWAHFLWSLHNC